MNLLGKITAPRQFIFILNAIIDKQLKRKNLVRIGPEAASSTTSKIDSATPTRRIRRRLSRDTLLPDELLVPRPSITRIGRARDQRTRKLLGIYDELPSLANYDVVALHLGQVLSYSGARSSTDNAGQILVTDRNPEQRPA